MASTQWAVVLRHVRGIFGGGAVAGLSEGQILDRFASGGDPAAFEALMARHGPMVLGVCRSILDDPRDVEDAFQATFLVLVRKAGGLRDRELLAPWLHGVARRVSLRARSVANRRNARERTGTDRPGLAPASAIDPDLRELQALVRDEVDRLPPHERAAVVYCYLEGLTHEEAADRLGWPVGTVKGRLARARDRLRDRLTRRGVAPSAGGLASVLAHPAPAAVPADLIASTTLAAARMAAGGPLTAGVVSAQALALASGVTRTMMLAKLKIAALAVGATCVLGSPGLVAVAYQMGGLGPAPPSPRASAARPAEGKREVRPSPVDAEELARSTPEQYAEKAMQFTPVQAAEEALRVMGLARAAGEKMAPELVYLWSKRLVDAELAAAGDRRDDRIRAIRANAERLKNNRQDVLALAQSGGLTAIDFLDAHYRYEEAAGSLARAQAEPAPPRRLPADQGGAMGGGFGGGFGGAFLGGGGDAAGPTVRTYRRPAKEKPSPTEEARNKAIQAKLDMPIAMNFKPYATLAEVIRHIKEATKGPDGKMMPIYVDPQGLQDADKTTQSSVSLAMEGAPLRTTLRLLLKQLSMVYEVDEGMLIITNDDPGDPRQKAMLEPSAADKALDAAILARLERPIPMHFPEDTPLPKVLAYIKDATRGPGEAPIPIYVDPQGLQDVDKTPEATVWLELEDVPLRTTLRLLLSQLGLGYEVRGGMLIIDRPEPDEPPRMNPAGPPRMGGQGGMM